MTPPSLSEITSAGSLLLMGAGQVVTWWLIVRDDKSAAITRSRQEGASQAAEAASIDKLAEANERIATALEKLEAWARDHELSDERRWAAHAEIQKSQSVTNDRLTNIAEDLARRITNIALDKAPGPVMEIPARRGRA